MEYTAIVDKYLKYMWNADVRADFRVMFDHDMAELLINKWDRVLEEYGGDGAPAVFWAQIDLKRQKAIMDRAVKFE